jgi:hypothetical protein
MPTDVPAAQHETALRRQITAVNIGVELDTKSTPSPLPTLTASVQFTDIFTTGSGSVVAYPVSGSATLTHAELLAIPNAPSVIQAIQELAYQRAIEQGL